MFFHHDYNNITAILLSSNNSWKFDDTHINLFLEPELSLYVSNRTTYIKKYSNRTEIDENALDLLNNYIKEGYFAIGYISYEYLESTDINVRLRKRSAQRWPELYFNLYKEDNKDKKNSILHCLDRLPIRDPLIDGIEINIPEGNHKKFVDNVNKIIGYIERGDVYQVNLSHLITVKKKIRPLELFFKYYKIQPVPYALYLKCEDFYFMSGSMELFLERMGNTIMTKPIKGTRRKVSDSMKNEELSRELYSDEKERAENLMIVDLMRNDLSKVCEIGTVIVDKLFDVKDYNTLFQMESAISGRLKNDISIRQIIEHVFPPGSVTGAPKRRSIQIIDELEDHSRGPYCGCAGLIRPDGKFTLSVSIRTCLMNDDDISYWTGSGIVYDSRPEREYQETLYKYSAFYNAIR